MSFLTCPARVCLQDVVVAIGIFGPYFPVAREDMKDWVRSLSDARESDSDSSGATAREMLLCLRQSCPSAFECGSPTCLSLLQFLVGRILRLWGFLGVPRELPGGQKGAGLSAALVERTRKADGMWLENPPVLIFPEGTCTTGRQLLRFKSGAFVPGRPVLPVTLNYKTRSGINSGWVLPPPVTAPFWRGLPRDITHLIRIVAATGKEIEARVRPVKPCGMHSPALTRRPSHHPPLPLPPTEPPTHPTLALHSQVTISPPYVPSPEEEKNPALFAANVRRTMAAMLGAPAECDFSGDDAKEFYKRVDDAASRTAR